MKCERIEESMPVTSVEGCSAIYPTGKAMTGTNLEEKKSLKFYSPTLNIDLTP